MRGVVAGRRPSAGRAGAWRHGSAGLAAAATPGSGAAIRRPAPGLAARPPGRGPRRGTGPAGVCRRRRHGGVRRTFGWAAGGVTGPPRRIAHQLPAGVGGRPDRSAGGRGIGDRHVGARPSGLCGLPALGRDVGPGVASRLPRSVGVACLDADPAQAGDGQDHAYREGSRLRKSSMAATTTSGWSR